MRRRCFVCGFRSAKPVCPRCNTILRPEQAVCATCDKAFEGWIAACDACGAPMKLANATLADREAVRSLASIPGMSDERAKELAAKGFRDLADVVRLALPERAVRQGLHHTIARKVLLADLVPRPQRSVSGAGCPMCGVARQRDPVRIVRLRVRSRTRSRRDRAEASGNHGRPREPRGGRRFPGDARRRPE